MRNDKRFLVVLLCGLMFILAGCTKVERETIKTACDIQIGGADELDISQSYFATGAHSIGKGESGYYYVENFKLMYYDSDTKTSVVLCGKANCNHNTQDCMADSKGASTVYYYNGYVYQVKVVSGSAVLVRIDKDGSNRVEIARLGAVSEGRVPAIAFCDKYIYYNIDASTVSENEVAVTLKRLSIEGGEPENVYEYKGINVNMSEISVYGENIYFVIKKYEQSEDGSGKLTSDGLYCTDTATKETKRVVNANVESYAIDSENGQLYYYVISDGLYRYDANKKEEKLIYKATEQSGMCDISFDGENVYMSNSSWKRYSRAFMKLDVEVKDTIWVYDKNDELVCTLDMDELGVSSVIFGDKDKLFINARNLNGISGIHYLDKSDLKSGKWTKL